MSRQTEIADKEMLAPDSGDASFTKKLNGAAQSSARILSELMVEKRRGNEIIHRNRLLE